MDLTERTIESKRCSRAGSSRSCWIPPACRTGDRPAGGGAPPRGVAVLALDEADNVALVRSTAIRSTVCCWSCPPASWTRGGPPPRRPSGS